MNEYNNSIEELLRDFEELQIKEIVNQVNINTEAPTGSVGSNFFNSKNYERGETLDPSKNYESPLRRIGTKNYRGRNLRRRKPTITEEFQPKNPIIQEPIPA